MLNFNNFFNESNKQHFFNKTENDISDWAIFRISKGYGKCFVTSLNQNDDLQTCDYRINYSDENVMKFTLDKAKELIKNNINVGDNLGVVNGEGIQKLFNWKIKFEEKYSDDEISESVEPIKTKKGTLIERYKDVGKKMGNDLYFYKDYVDEYIDNNFYNKLKNYLPKDVKFNIIKYNNKDEYISFIYSPNFNSADEPIVSDAYKVTKDGKVTLTKEKSIPQIYHHKWMFVKDDYKGFNVDKSKNRSKTWLEVSDRINMFKIGSKGYWEKEVLPLIEGSIWSTKKQEFSSSRTSIKQIPAPVKRLLTNNELKDRTINLDIGGGKYDDMSTVLAKWGLKNYVYDPYNRTKEHNLEVIKKTKNGQADSVTIFNVLNVIQEKENQLRVLRQAKNALKKDGKAFIYSNYYVKGKVPGEIKGRDSYQQYYKLKDTLPLIREVFPKAFLNSKLSCVVAPK